MRALWEATVYGFQKVARGVGAASGLHGASAARPSCVSGQILSYTDADSLRPEAQPGAQIRRHPGDHHRHQPERGQQCGGAVREAALPLPQVSTGQALGGTARQQASSG